MNDIALFANTKAITQWHIYLWLLGLVVALTGCFTDNKSESYFFEGDIRTLLIQEAEVPSGWSFDRTSSDPSDEEVIANWGVVYASRPTLNHMTTVINHSVVTFKRQEVAIERFENNYQYRLSTRNPAVEPPQKYRYKSPTADEFEIICTSVNNLDSLLIGYDCLYSARYGNVMSELIIYIQKEDGIKASEANLLSWAEVEGLLKLIDEKFEKAGFVE